MQIARVTFSGVPFKILYMSQLDSTTLPKGYGGRGAVSCIGGLVYICVVVTETKLEEKIIPLRMLVLF